VSASAVSGRIPIRLEPIAGECFDGWLDAYAQRLTISTVQLGEALDVSHELLRLRCAKLARADRAPDSERVAARACGIDPGNVAATWQGLARYHRLIEQRLGSGALSRATRPMTWSRFCPTCLSESDGRWLVTWRLPWYLACATHETMLANACPSCDGPQRDRTPRAAYARALMTACSHPRDAIRGRRDNRCRHDLTAHPTPDPAPIELLGLQAELATVLDPAVSDDDAAALVERLVDVLVVSTHVGLDLGAIDGHRHNAADVLAGPLSEARRALADPSGSRMGALANSDARKTPRPLPGSWREASPRLASVLLVHRDPRLRTMDRLRYRSIALNARRPEGIDPAARLPAIPLALWPDWAIRLRPATIEATNFRISAAAALCVPGATATLSEIAESWPATQVTANLTRLGRLIAADPHGDAILRALCVLTDELDRDGAPIDYERRRRLASEIELLDARSWTTMARAGATPTGQAFKLRAARLWIWETVTGGLPEQAPRSLRPMTPAELPRYQRFALELPAPTVQRLLDHARDLLDTHGCREEPVTWSPRRAGIATETLPGPDPDIVDPLDVHALLAKCTAPGDVAAQLAITLDHLRYLTRRHPSDNLSGRQCSRVPPRVRLAAVVTPTQLRQQIQDGATLTGLAERYGVQRSTVRAELVAHDIELPPNHRRRHQIDRDWLREQYLVKQRTTEEIAAATGASPTTVVRLLREYAIPARGRGTPSHQQSLTAGEGYPEPLASAVLRPGGSQRVRRFQVYAHARSLNAASKQLGVHQSTLTTQLAALEEACAGPLLQRLTRDQRPQRITALGQTLLDQADHYLGPHPGAPRDLPDPLAAVLAAHWGHKMLATFAAATTLPTLNDAAQAAGVHTTSLQRTISNLERAIGEPVLDDHRASAPIRLTPIGRRLLRQGRDHPATTSRAA